MKKKRVVEKVGGAEKTQKTHAPVNKELIENFIILQRVMTNVSIKFDKLSDRITKLLELFEVSAKSFAEKDFSSFEKHAYESKELNNKLREISEQNKTILNALNSSNQYNELQGEAPSQYGQYNQPNQPNQEPQNKGMTEEDFMQSNREEQSELESPEFENTSRNQNQEEYPAPEQNWQGQQNFGFKKMPKY